MTTKSSNVGKDDSFISEEVKSKALELGNILLQGMVLATGSLIVNGVADRYKIRKQQKQIKSSSSILEFTDKAANS